jgi:hypothetical protein
MRDNSDAFLVSSSQGRLNSLEMGALRHLQCSSLQDFQVMNLLCSALKFVNEAEDVKTMKRVII